MKFTITFGDHLVSRELGEISQRNKELTITFVRTYLFNNGDLW